jgi:hypothetical protein
MRRILSLITVVMVMAAIVAVSAATAPAEEACPWECAVGLLNEATQRVPVLEEAAP